MNFPLVTVGVASFNNALYLRETLESIRLQTYANIEVIIVDDASRDDSVLIAKKWFTEHPDVNGRLICHESNLGVCRVCNDIITHSQGDFISIVGSDDVFMPDKLTHQVATMLQSPQEVGVIFGDITHIDSAGNYLEAPSYWVTPQSGKVFMALLDTNFIPAMSTLVRRSCYNKVGLYDESLSYEDIDMWLRIAREFEFLYVPGENAKYRIHKGSATFSRQLQLIDSSLKLLQKHRDFSPDADRLITKHTRRLAESYYLLGGTDSKKWLWLGWKELLRHNNRWMSLAYLISASAGIPAASLRKLYFGLVGRK
ncbi:glycosyltransferase involved in cell wall biosynthesis [Hymenobacter sp. UYAg731]